MHGDRKKRLAFIALPLAVGVLAGFLSMSGMALYKTLNLASQSPPGWLFPIIWAFLFILMGNSSYMIAASPPHRKKEALRLYGFQLFLNFIRILVFFRLHHYLLAFIILLFLWYYIYKMIVSFWTVNPMAALLQIPYLLWVTFTGYLNLAVVFLN